MKHLDNDEFFSRAATRSRHSLANLGDLVFIIWGSSFIRHSTFGFRHSNQFVFIRVDSWLLLLQRVIERALNIEFSDALREDGIVCDFNDAWILKEIEEAPLSDKVRDFRIAS